MVKVFKSTVIASRTAGRGYNALAASDVSDKAEAAKRLSAMSLSDFFGVVIESGLVSSIIDLLENDYKLRWSDPDQAVNKVAEWVCSVRGELTPPEFNLIEISTDVQQVAVRLLSTLDASLIKAGRLGHHKLPLQRGA